MADEMDITKKGVDASSAFRTPQPHPTIENVPVAAEGDLHTDIAHILEETPLPERTQIRTQGDLPQQKQPTPTIEPKPVPTIEVPHATDNQLSAIRTLRADVQDAIHDEHISLTSVLSMETERKRLKRTAIEANSAGDTQRKRRTAGILFATLLLVALGASAIFGVVTILQQQGSAANAPGVSSGIVFAEHSVGLPLDNTSPQALKAQIAQALTQQNGALGSILQIVPILTATSSDGSSSMRPATLEEFFQALAIQPPSDLMRALGSTFFFGIHATAKNSPVFIVPVISYDRAFAGMLGWEPRMNQDFAPIFPQLSPYTIGQNGLPTARTFKDLVMQNYDTRTLEDDSGATVIYYTFPTQNYLIISESQATLTEVLSRMQARREI